MKKIANILLSLAAIVFLLIGIAYTRCPIIPYIKYTWYDIYDPLKPTGHYAIYYLDSSYEVYSLADNRLIQARRDMPTEIFEEFNICKDKCTIRSPGLLQKASFNPTPIFYVISAGAIVALVCVNRRRKEYEEVREVRQERQPRIDPRYERRRRR